MLTKNNRYCQRYMMRTNMPQSVPTKKFWNAYQATVMIAASSLREVGEILEELAQDFIKPDSRKKPQAAKAPDI